MGNVIYLDKFRKKTQKKEDIKQEFKDSLDNDRVMQRYGINKRMESIHKRIDTINNLMKELDRINKGEGK
ncbi:hypothetical protein EBR25_14300 [bacterium]|nr:hypothetical protein [bacterium]